MRRIVKTFRRPPTGRIRDRNGGLPRLSDGVAHASLCPASPQRPRLAENLGKPSLWVMISAPWYKRTPAREGGPGGLRGPYPATANANTLTVHTITPAIVILTVCCHMVSIPYSGRCWVER